jgi:cytochrome c-type biogenesis protein CcmE
MNTRMKKRLGVVTGLVVIVLIVTLAIAAGGTASTSVTVAQALESGRAGQKIQVTGTVVNDSYAIDNDRLTFKIYDPSGDASAQLLVRYDGGVAATFGNGVTAICTGRIDESGMLLASELVTKCPSKYESVTDALGVKQLLDYGDVIIDKPVKVTGKVIAGSIKPVGGDERFVLEDATGGSELKIVFDGALSDEITDGSSLVITGSLNAQGSFDATNVALEG